MSTQRPIVLLTQGEPNLEHYARVLEDEGWPVFATESPVEASILLARRPGSVFVARRTLLPESLADFLSDLRRHAAVDRLVLAAAEEDREIARLNGHLPADMIVRVFFPGGFDTSAVGESPDA